MRKNLKVIAIAMLLLHPILVITSCKKDVNFDMYYDYFPLNEGHYNVYSVREVIVDQQINVLFDFY